MARLVEDAEIYGYLGVSQDKDPDGVVVLIRDAVEDMLVLQTGRDFGPGATFVNEPYDGFGTRLLHLKRNLQTLTGITIRWGASNGVDYVLDVSNVIWQVGKRRIALSGYAYGNSNERSCLVFPCGYGNILISYTSQADTPPLAAQAVRECTATFYRRRGSEDARSEQIGTFQHVLLRTLDESLAFKKAVELLQVPTLG
jgi:hypothetical protein